MAIHIKPSKRGTFTAAATKHGKGVQAFASQVLAHKENYSPTMVKKANFARNASKWKHEDGGMIESGGDDNKNPIEKPQTKKAPTKAPTKKRYNLDDEILPVLKATSQFDKDSTFQDIVKRASDKTGVNPKLLFTSSFQEGMNQAALHPDNVSEAYQKAKVSEDFPVDGFFNYGLDRFSEMAPELVKKGYLPKDFSYKSFNAKNEKKEDIKTAAFRNNEDALVAKAAVLKNEKDKVVAYAKKKGVQLTPETEDYFTLASYNGGSGNAEKMLDEYQAAGGKGTDFITKDQTTRKGVSKNILPRYQRMAKLSEYFADGGIITPADEDINKQFFKGIQQQQSGLLNYQEPDLLSGAASLVPNQIGGAPDISVPQKVQQKQRYSGPNPFIMGLTAIDMAIPKEQNKRKYNRPQDNNYYNPYQQGTGSQAIMEKGGKIAIDGSGITFNDGGKMSSYEQGGELELYDDKTSAKPLSDSANPIIEFKGPSHEQSNNVGTKGIPMSYRGQPAEVEGGETGFQDMDGDFHVLGNLTNLLTGRLFKNDGKMLAKQESKATKEMKTGMKLLGESDPTDPFEKLKFNTAEAKIKGAKSKLKKVNMMKELLSNLQQQQLSATKSNPKAEGGFVFNDPRDPAKRKSQKTTVSQTPELATITPTERSFDVTTPKTINPVTTIPNTVPDITPNIESPMFNFGSQPSVKPRSNAQGIDPANFTGELYALATNKVEPVKAQQYTPELQQPFNVSFQDRINRNTGTFRAALQEVAGNPSALASLAAQKYSADNEVSADEFRTNQSLESGAYNENRKTMNEAKLTNLGILDQQYGRQVQAKSNTQERTFDALSSIADKVLKNKAQQSDLKVLENLYDFRFDNDFVANYEGSGPNFRKSIVAGVNPYSTTKAALEAKTKRAVTQRTTEKTSGKYGMSLTREYKTIK